MFSGAPVVEAAARRFPIAANASEKWPRVIALSGQAGAGKDLVAAMLYMLGFERIAFADPLRDEVRSAIATQTIPLDAPLVVAATIKAGDCAAVDRKPTSDGMRATLQWWGTEYRRQRDGEDYWVSRMSLRIRLERRYVITDCRFPNEVAFAKARGGVVWRVERPNLTVGGIEGHASEKALEKFAPDVVIRNAGSLHDLAKAVRREVDKW